MVEGIDIATEIPEVPIFCRYELVLLVLGMSDMGKELEVILKDEIPSSNREK